MFSNALTFVLLFLLPAFVLATDLALEPCINGAVSSSGAYPSQEIEDYVRAELDWRSYYFDLLATRQKDMAERAQTGDRPPFANAN